MRRAVILATLTCILFAVAGVTVATENTFTPDPQSGDSTESTVLESTLAGRTAPETIVPEATVPETTVSEAVEKPVEGAEGTTVVVRKEPKAPGKGDPGAGSYGGIREVDRIEKAGGPTGKPDKPEHARVAGEPPGKSRPDKDRPEHAGKNGIGGNPGKVTLCHKNRVTISVGAPAEPAHLRHGDEPGAC